MELLRYFITLLEQLVLVFVPFSALALLFFGLLDLILGHALVVRLLVLLLRGGHALVPALEGQTGLLSVRQI